MTGPHKDYDLETAKTIGELGANVKTILERQDRMEKKLDGVVAMTNRWKGASALLIVIAGALGYLSNVVLKLIGKA